MADEMRIVLLGKTGYGKSSSGNTILGHSTGVKFVVNSTPNSVTSKCEALTGHRPGKETQIKIIDTPGFFDTSGKELLPEIVKCIAICAPGPHAFIIVLRVDRYTVQEAANVAEITRSFGEDAFKYSAVLFTEGDRLPEGQTIEQFVDQNKELKKLVKKCGGGCHVIDNRYWNQEHEYRSNRVQVEKLLNTIEKMVRQNGGGCYTNEMLQAVEEGIQREEEEIRKQNKMSSENNRDEAISRFVKKILAKCAGVAAGAFIGALLGIGVVACLAVMQLKSKTLAPGLSCGVAAINYTTAFKVVGTIGAIKGGIVGYQAVEDGDGVVDAMKKAARANLENAKYIGAEAKGLVKGLASELDTICDAVKKADSVVTKMLETTTINEGHNTNKNE